MHSSSALRRFATAAALLRWTTSVRAGVADTPLPTFSTQRPARLIAVLPRVVKHLNIETLVTCTNLDPAAAVDIGFELFDPNGVRANTIATGNGAVVNVAPGATVTISTGGSASLHEDAVITLEPPVVSIPSGSGRIVASAAKIACTAQAVDRLHNVVSPALSAQRPPSLTDLSLQIVATAAATTSTTSSTSTSSTSTTRVPGTSTSTSLAPRSTSTSTSTSSSTALSSSTSTTSSTASTSSTTSTTAPITPAVCAARGGLEAIRCFCQFGEKTGCTAPLPPSVGTPFKNACQLQDRASAAVKPHARAALTARARSTLKTAVRRAQRAGVRGTVSVGCAQTFATISGGL